MTIDPAKFKEAREVEFDPHFRYLRDSRVTVNGDPLYLTISPDLYFGFLGVSETRDRSSPYWSTN